MLKLRISRKQFIWLTWRLNLENNFLVENYMFLYGSKSNGSVRILRLNVLCVLSLLRWHIDFCKNSEWFFILITFYSCIHLLKRKMGKFITKFCFLLKVFRKTKICSFFNVSYYPWYYLRVTFYKHFENLDLKFKFCDSWYILFFITLDDIDYIYIHTVFITFKKLFSIKTVYVKLSVQKNNGCNF